MNIDWTVPFTLAWKLGLFLVGSLLVFIVVSLAVILAVGLGKALFQSIKTALKGKSEEAREVSLNHPVFLKKNLDERE